MDCSDPYLANTDFADPFGALAHVMALEVDDVASPISDIEDELPGLVPMSDLVQGVAVLKRIREQQPFSQEQEQVPIQLPIQEGPIQQELPIQQEVQPPIQQQGPIQQVPIEPQVLIEQQQQQVLIQQYWCLEQQVPTHQQQGPIQHQMPIQQELPIQRP